MNENGPRTHELVEEFEKIREFMREDRHEVNRRLTALETKVALGLYIGGAIFGALLTFGVLVFVGVLNP